MIPDTMCLSFKFVNSNTKSWFLNNFGRLLVDRLSIKIQGTEVYQNTEESLLEAYRDLWKTEEKRKNMVKYGIANENTRKLMPKDDSANKAAKTDGVLDLTIANTFERMKIPLGKVLRDNGSYAPYGMFNFVYSITLPPSKKIIKAQDGEDVGKYKLEDILLKYDVIDSEDLVREVKDQYSIGRSLGYEYVNHYESQNWAKERFIESRNVREYSKGKHEGCGAAIHRKRCR